MTNKPPARTDAPPVAFMVLESFMAEVDGVPTVFRSGDTVEPGHPALRRWPKLFGPLQFTHRRARSLSTPEVRAD